jgi:hypothetical protein
MEKTPDIIVITDSNSAVLDRPRKLQTCLLKQIMREPLHANQ